MVNLSNAHDNHSSRDSKIVLRHSNPMTEQFRAHNGDTGTAVEEEDFLTGMDESSSSDERRSPIGEEQPNAVVD